MFPSHLSKEELFRNEKYIPNLATDLAEAGLILLHIEQKMTPAAQEVDQLELVKLLSKAKSQYYLKVAKGEVEDPMFNRKTSIRRVEAYLKRAGCSPKEIGTTQSEIDSISLKLCECGGEIVSIYKETPRGREIWDVCQNCKQERQIDCQTCFTVDN